MNQTLPEMPNFAHAHAFDPTYGFSYRQLQQMGAPDNPPPDFADFWRKTMREASAATRLISSKLLESPSPEWRLASVKIETLDGSWFGAWVLSPVDVSRIKRGFVFGHGYGGREAPDWPVAFEDAAYIFPCAQGFHLSAQDGVPGNSAEHVILGIESRETYILRHCVAALQSAAGILIGMFPQAEGNMGFIGGSFGGGLGAILLPWSNSFQRAFLKVPTFGNHPVRLQCQCVGSGESVRRLALQNPSILKTLPYFDAATAATFIDIPVLAAVALFDPAVPPPGQFAVANALAGPKHIHLLSASHFEDPSLAAEEMELNALVKTWFENSHK